MLFHTRSFSTTPCNRSQVPHPLWKDLDWAKIANDMYAVVDPLSPRRILYLSEQDYIVMVRVAWTNNRTLKVLACPGDTPESSSTSSSTQKMSPYHPFIIELMKNQSSRFSGRVSHLFHSTFAHWIVRDEDGENPMIEISDRNIEMVISRWFNIVSYWARGEPLDAWSSELGSSTYAARDRDNFSKACASLLRNNGPAFLIAYLKACLYVINAFLSGRKLKRNEVPGKVFVEVRNGLPKILPLAVRVQIRRGHLPTIRTWASVCNSYKAFKGSWGSVSDSLESIRRVHPNLDSHPVLNLLQEYFFPKFWAHIRNKFNGILIPNLIIDKMFSTNKAGPNCPNSVLGAPQDAALWMGIEVDFNDPLVDISITKYLNTKRVQREISGLKENLIRLWLEETKNWEILNLFYTAGISYKRIQRSVSKRVRSISNLYDPALKDTPKPTDDRNQSVIRHALNQMKYPVEAAFNYFGFLLGGLDYNYPCESYNDRVPKNGLGKLHALFEPAGKIRIIAIVDYWTNAVLKPLHDFMFSILRVIPTDATFDQEGRLEAFVQKGHTKIWSLDLSSATDLIPLFLYRSLFIKILGETITDLWLRLLSERVFITPKETWEDENSPGRIQYGTGQPMGALSSWASMALVHHGIVQCAHFFVAGNLKPSDINNTEFNLDALSALAGLFPQPFDWFEHYLVLGDDVVIADEGVATMYQELCKSLGISINLKKSHISEISFLNFANQSYKGSANVSPASLKEFAGIDSLSKRSEMAMRLVRRGWVDLKGRNWVNQIIRLFVNPNIKKIIIKDLQNGRTHPIVHWILSVLLVPGSERFSDFGLTRVSFDTLLAAMRQRAVIWNKPLGEIHELINERDMWGQIALIMSGIVKRVDRLFEDSKTSFESYDRWAALNISPGGTEVLKRVIYRSYKERLDTWETKYTKPLKILQGTLYTMAVLSSMRSRDTHFHELGIPVNLSDYITIANNAAAAVPLLPDFASLNFEVLVPSEETRAAYKGELPRFIGLLSSVITTEDLVRPRSLSEDDSFFQNKDPNQYW